MVDFLRDETGDLDLNENLVTLVQNNEDAVKQRLEMKLFTNRGEWKLNLAYGIPWLTESGEGQLLGRVDQSYFDSILKESILNDPDVREIISFRSNWDKQQGIYTVAVSLSTPYGNIDNLILEGEL